MGRVLHGRFREGLRVSYRPGPPVEGTITRVGRLFVFVVFDGADGEESACDPANLELVEDRSEERSDA